ncbi:MAG: hypothetical protein QNJ57_07790 [Flavobacteriaceae bacterium]|nr:hypothetical protein [Flavobacteriaceae bacterium]
MRIKLHVIALLLAVSTMTFAQIGIGTTTPDASAIIDMTSTSQGILIPRMTTAQRTAIASPALGLQVYDTDTSSVWSFNGADWINGTGGPGKFIDGAAADIAYYDGRVGIGRNNFSTAHKLWVEGVKSTDDTNTTARFIAEYEGTGTSVSTYAATFDANNTSTGTIGFAIGSYNTINNSAGGSITVGEATRSEINNPASGSMAAAYGNSINVTNDGAITSFLVGNLINNFGTGTAQNSYAIFIGPGFNTGIADNYSIYSSTVADSYFSGNIGAGILAPQRQVHISEALRLEPQADPPANGALGDLYADTDGNLYFHDGTNWRQVQLVP